jgi:hypothetical protein
VREREREEEREKGKREREREKEREKERERERERERKNGVSMMTLILSSTEAFECNMQTRHTKDGTQHACEHEAPSH